MSVWVVTAEESGQRLSAFLKSKLGSNYSARQIKHSVERNACLINGQVERFVTSIVGKGDRISYNNVPRRQTLLAAVLYEDDHLLACDKPTGLASDDPTLPPLPGLILLHRLDKDTTGVLLWAKNKVVAGQMCQLFKKRQIKKMYLAVVDGVPRKKRGCIKNFLGRIHQYQGQSLWGAVEVGDEAITDWCVEQEFGLAALLHCYPQTGRTHQIRVHLSGMGHPILGDKQYGKRFRCPYQPSRCLLHASQIVFTHPVTNETIEITAPMPADIREAIQVI